MTCHRRLAAGLSIAALALAAPLRVLAGPLDTFGTDPKARGERSAPGSVAPLRFVLRTGYDAGRYSTGFGVVDPDGNLRDLSLNGGAGAALGVNYSLDPSGTVSTQVTAGFKHDAVSEGGMGLQQSSWQLDAITYALLGSARVGLGVNYVSGSLESSGFSPDTSTNFEGFGFVAEAGLIVPISASDRGAAAVLGVRYVKTTLESPKDGWKAAGDSIGVVLDFLL